MYENVNKKQKIKQTVTVLVVKLEKKKIKLKVWENCWSHISKLVLDSKHLSREQHQRIIINMCMFHNLTSFSNYQNELKSVINTSYLHTGLPDESV